MTLFDLVQRVSEQLESAGVAFGHGTTNAFDEAAWLVQWQLKLPLDGLDAAAERSVAPAELAAVQELVQRRISTRRPAAYLTGEAWLQGVPFFVDERVIVPRSLVAEPLMDGALDVWLAADPRSVLDLGTGSGCLAVLAALVWPQAKVHATDVSAAALAVAQNNIQRHDLAHRITLALGDGLAPAPGRYDLILCNPPYVNRISMAALPAEYRAEPALALDGGADGMDFIRKLLRKARAHMTDNAVLVLEIGNERAHFDAAFPHLPAVWLPTSAGDDQVLLIEAESLE